MKRIRSRAIPHTAGAPTLEVVNLSVSYNGTPVLKEISFRIEPRQRVAVVGPNGAGKSTLFKVIAGVLPPSAGQVHIYGHEPYGHICIAYIPQRNQIDWTFPVTVADVVMMGRVGKIGLFRWPTRHDWHLVHDSLRQVGLDHLANQQIGELSGGQQQRVFIARALAQEAELALLDEPFTGLDVPSQQAILQILDHLQEHGVTVMVATHDLNLAADHFDLVIVLNQQIVAVGRPAQVLTPETLLQAYGGHVHRLPVNGGEVVLADTCCGGGEVDR